MATEISWLLPTALLALAAGLYLTWNRPRTDLKRAGLVLFGVSLVATLVTFSFMQGVIHPYYTIAMAPLIGAVIAITAGLLWEQRATWTARVMAAVLIETTVVWDLHLLGSWQPTVRTVVLLASIAAVVGLVFGEWFRHAVAFSLVAAVLAGLGGSAAYAVSTASHAHTGSIPSSGPVASSMGGGPGGGGTTTTSAELVALLKATTTRWAAAAQSTMSAAGPQLASGRPVMAIGGFNGGDNAPTLAQFQAYVAAGDIGYYLSGGGMGGQGSNAIATWVAANFTAQTVGGVTVYDLTP